MAQKPRVIILRTAGTNCNEETAFAFRSVGAAVDQVHINRIFSGEKSLDDYHILAIPGGFSYGDDIAAGRILANELTERLGRAIRAFVTDGKLVIGICNGFQVLVKAGILPGGTASRTGAPVQTATLMTNDSGTFEDRWTYLKPDGRCAWTEGMTDVVYMPVAHAEGKFVVRSKAVLKRLRDKKQIVFRYCAADGKKPDYPANPNGSVDDIAGITDPTGRVLGMMPHPERHFLFTQHPFWTRFVKRPRFGDGEQIFRNGVRHVRQHFKLA